MGLGGSGVVLELGLEPGLESGVELVPVLEPGSALELVLASEPEFELESALELVLELELVPEALKWFRKQWSWCPCRRSRKPLRPIEESPEIRLK